MVELTFSHLSSDNFELESQRKAGRKRPRIREAVSCQLCRSRKIRCNREQPCFQCTERGVGSRCTYARLQPLVTSQATPAGLPQQPPDGSGPDDPLQPQPQQPPQPEAALPPPPHALVSPTSQRKRFMVGMSHWLMPCRELRVSRAMINRAEEFRPSLEAFAAVKERLLLENAIPMPHVQLSAISNMDVLALLASSLPSRPACERWISRYFHGYNRVLPLLDPFTLAADLEQTFSPAPPLRLSGPTPANTIFLLRTAVTVGVAMQASEEHRLHGRRLGRLAEAFLLSVAHVQKPCIGNTQVLILLVLLHTVAALDAEGSHDLINLLSLGTYMTSAMGLHRDPAAFDSAVSSYYAEIRKRMWAIFLQLNLTYSTRTGTQTTLSFDDCDCPPPAPDPLPDTPEELTATARSLAASWMLSDEQIRQDAVYAHVSAAAISRVGPIYQTLCSANPIIPPEKQAELRQSFALVVDKMKPEIHISDPMRTLQQTMMSTGMHSFLLIISLSNMLGSGISPFASVGGDEDEVPAYDRPVDLSRQPHLIDIWDFSSSIIENFVALFQQGICDANGASSSSPASAACASSAFMTSSSPSSSSLPPCSGSLPPNGADGADMQAIAMQILWAGVCRASLAACLSVDQLRRLDLSRNMPFAAHPHMPQRNQHTASIYHGILVQSLMKLSRVFFGKYHLGPITAKIYLLLAVIAGTSEVLYSDYDGLYARGVAMAEQAVADMSADLDRRGGMLNPDQMPAVGSGNSIDNDAGVDAYGFPPANVMSTDVSGGADHGISMMASPNMAAPVADSLAANMDPAVLGVSSSYEWSSAFYHDCSQTCAPSRNPTGPYTAVPNMIGMGADSGAGDAGGASNVGGDISNFGFDIQVPNIEFSSPFFLPPGSSAVSGFDLGMGNYAETPLKDFL